MKNWLNNFIREIGMLPIILGVMLSYGIGFFVGSDIDVLKKQQAENHEILNHVSRSVYWVGNQVGWGTGFAMTGESGTTYIVTNAHVCLLAKAGNLALLDGKRNTYGSNVIYVDKDIDICLLEAPENAATLSFSSSFKKGDTVYAIGYPLSPTLTMSSGYIKDYGIIYQPFPIQNSVCNVGGLHLIKDAADKEHCVYIQKILETTTTYDRGGSGSPLVDINGNVIGVVNAIKGNAAWATAIPQKELKAILMSH